MALELPNSMRLVAGLWPKESARGHTYFCGGNRKEKVYLFYDPDAGETDPPWKLYTEDRTPKPAPSGGRTGPVAGFPGGKVPTRPNRRQRSRKAAEKTPPADLPNDALEDLFKGG